MTKSGKIAAQTRVTFGDDRNIEDDFVTVFKEYDRLTKAKIPVLVLSPHTEPSIKYG